MKVDESPNEEFVIPAFFVTKFSKEIMYGNGNSKRQAMGLTEPEIYVRLKTPWWNYHSWLPRIPTSQVGKGYSFRREKPRS